MTIESVRFSLANYQRVVVLREKDSDRYLCIFIGVGEADAIAIKLQGAETPRPLTHDLLGSTIERLGGRVLHVVVSEVSNDTFFARIVLEANGETIDIDSRSSDALALAVRAGVPIYAEDAVLTAAGVYLEDNTAETGEAVASERPAPVDPAELERLGAFKDFIEGLDLDDFDQRKS
ncbi:MAG: bifunctional nuclease family protein [Dehalococcoidia bacterium]